jgi:nicotinamidase-related amidase
MKAISTQQAALLIVDVQNAYFNNDALHEQQDVLLKNINELIHIAKQHHIPIFNIRTEHQEDIASWTLNMLEAQQGYLFKDHNDSQSVPGLAVDQSVIEVIKTRDSAFHDTNLEAMLKNHAITTLILCGVSTHTCILQTAADAYAANLKVILAKDAIASHKPEYHDVALDILSTEYNQPALSTTKLKNNIQNDRQ